MRSALIASLTAVAAALPLEVRQSYPSDGAILNYALTLEYLESTFYNETLQKFSHQDFLRAGLADPFYNNLREIAYDEATHVSFLSGALTAAGATPVTACTYNFDLSSVQSFLQLANVLEGVGVSAYLGAAQYISTKAYLTAAGSILTVEARHNAYLREHQEPDESPFPAPFDIPLDFNEVYSLASQFITSCPSVGNPTIAFQSFPALTLNTQPPVSPGQTISVTPAKTVSASAAWFITAAGPVEATLTSQGANYNVVVPTGVQPGQEYLVLTSDNNKPTDNNIVAGPAIVPIADNDSGENYQWGHGHKWGVKGWWNLYGGSWQQPS